MRVPLVDLSVGHGELDVEIGSAIRRVIDANEARQLGIVMDVVPADQLMDAAMTLARSIAQQPAKATRLTKRLMKMAQRTELRDFLDICACFQGMSHNEPEHLEVVNRMLDTLARKQ